MLRPGTFEDVRRGGGGRPGAEMITAHSILEAAIETSRVLSTFVEETWPRPFFVGVPMKYSHR